MRLSLFQIVFLFTLFMILFRFKLSTFNHLVNSISIFFNKTNKHNSIRK